MSGGTIDVLVELPSLVASACGVPRRVELALDRSRADTDGLLVALFASYPGVRSHLVDERGRLRANVLCAVDDRATRFDEPHPLRHRSSVRFVPSVAGG